MWPAIPAVCASAPADALVEATIRVLPPPGAPRTVALTLDACGGGTDMRILDTLIALSIPATILATGLWLRANASTVALLREHPGLFSVQNHGAFHVPAVLGDREVYGLPAAGTMEAIEHEILGGADAVVAAGFARPRWYRDATALYSPAAIGRIEALGFRVAGFSLNADEGASLPARAVARNVSAARSGDVIIGHMNQPHRPSGAGMAEGIVALQSAATAFVTLDALPVTPAAYRPHEIAHRRPVLIS